MKTHFKIPSKHPLFFSTICRVNEKRYRYGFNGKEKDNETYGEGNAYDFGARIYDSRLGRWLSLDPLMIKYPELSPYHSFANNPIVFIDPSGKENVVYLVVLSSAFTPEGGNLTWKEIEAYVAETNAAYKSMGLETRMEIFSKNVSKTEEANFDMNKMDKTDQVVAFGSPQSVVDWAKSKMGSNEEEKKLFEEEMLDTKDKNGNLQSGAIGYTSRETNIIGVASNKIKPTAKNLMKSKDGKYVMKASDWFAITILHETGHNSGLGHAHKPTVGPNTSAIMNEGDRISTLVYGGKKYNYFITNVKLNYEPSPGEPTTTNQEYVESMKKKFGSKTAQRNYAVPEPKSKKNNTTKKNSQ